MTISTQLTKITYHGDGSTFQWTFSFPGHDPSAIIVYITDASGNIIQQPAIAYTVVLNAPVAPNPTGIGGTVTLNNSTPLPVGQMITIQRILPEIQQTSIANQSIVYPPIVELQYDYLTMVDQQLQEQIDRAFKVAISDPSPAPLPPVAQRAGFNAIFDSAGNLTAGTAIVGGVSVSAAMVPVVTAATIKAAQTAFGLGPFGYAAISGQKLQISGPTTVINSMKGLTLVATGGLYTIQAANVASIDDDYQILIFNNDGRGKNISIPVGGVNTVIMLWPGQWMLLSKYAGTWNYTTPGRYRPPVGVTLYVNSNLGSDANDGLARGAGAFQTINGAVQVVEQYMDGQVTIMPEAGMSFPTSGVVVDGLKFNHSITILGDGPISPPGIQVTGSAGSQVFQIINGAIVGLKNLFITTAAAAGTGVYCANGGVCNLNACSFGPINGVHMEIFENATLNVAGFYDVYGGCTTHIYSHGSGYVGYNPTTVGFGGAMNIGTFMEAVYNSSIIMVPSISFSNPSFVTGNQVFIDYNSSIVSGGNTIPGTALGTVGTHGGYLV